MILQALDYIILATVLLLSLGIGVFFACYGGRQKTTAEYFTGNKKMKTFPIVMSMLATYITSSMLLGIPAEVYYFGFYYLYIIIIGAFTGGPIAIYGFMPVFYKLQITSIFEYVEYRFNKTLRRCTSLLNIITFVIITSFATYAPAIALSQVTGLNVWISILTTIVIGTIYTCIGGIKAVVWTDVLQLVIFTIVLMATIINSCTNVDNLANILHKNIEGKRLDAPSLSLDPRIRYTAWGLLITPFIGHIMFGTSQAQLQRIMCCPTKRSARRCMWLNLMGTIALAAIICFIGLILYATYSNCDPLMSHQIQRPDQIFPLFVMQTMSSIPGMPGLFIAAVYCAALSSISSQINCLAALTLEDHIKPRWKKLTDIKATFISKCLVVGYGLICLLMIIAIMNLGSILETSQYLMGGTYGVHLSLFFLGMMNPWATSEGTIIGIASGLGVSWWITIGNQIYQPPSISLLPLSISNCSNTLSDLSQHLIQDSKTDDILDIYKISYVWITPISFTISVIVGSLSSLFVGSNDNLDMNLLSPFVHSIMKIFCSKNKYIAMSQMIEVKTPAVIEQKEAMIK